MFSTSPTLSQGDFICATAMMMMTTTIMTNMMALVPVDGPYQPIATQVTEPQPSYIISLWSQLIVI